MEEIYSFAYNGSKLENHTLEEQKVYLKKMRILFITSCIIVWHVMSTGFIIKDMTTTKMARAHATIVVGQKPYELVLLSQR